MMAEQRSHTDVVIAGAGFAGLALAIALRQGLGADFSVGVADPALGRPASEDARSSAIAAGARRLLETIDVWNAVAVRAQPILDMVITDSRLEDATRPVFLTFAGNVEPGEPFAHMVENRYLIDALAKNAEANGVELKATAVASYEPHGDAVDVRLADGGAQRRHDLARRAFRREYSDPKIVFDVEAELLERGHVGQRLRARRAENGERAQLARFDVRQRGRHRLSRDLGIVAEDGDDGRTAAVGRQMP